jgi:hypothetical protein
MMPFAVLLEGESDAPVMRELLRRQFNLREGVDFDLIWHSGKGQLPKNLLGATPQNHRNLLLNSLPKKLEGMSHRPLVLVVMDLDKGDHTSEMADLENMLKRLPKKPIRVLFRFAIEETESWFIADMAALNQAFPRQPIDLNSLMRIKRDAIVGAWEVLAKALNVNLDGISKQEIGILKLEWALAIAPYLNFQQPESPSLSSLISGIDQELKTLQKLT